MSREAMKLALEALEAITVDVKTTPTAYEAQRQAITALREALAEQPAQQCKWPTCQNEEYQQALAEQIKRELVGEQPAPAQGPAAYMYASIAGPVILHRLEQIGVAKDWCVEAQLANDMKAAKRYPKAHSCTPLYTTPQTAQQEPVGKVIASVKHLRSISVELLPEVTVPPVDSMIYTTPQPAQRTWVGLTEDEVFAVSNTMPYGDRFNFAEAIEAKLRSKNI